MYCELLNFKARALGSELRSQAKVGGHKLHRPSASPSDLERTSDVGTKETTTLFSGLRGPQVDLPVPHLSVIKWLLHMAKAVDA
jgi:hypothetical protein